MVDVRWDGKELRGLEQEMRASGGRVADAVAKEIRLGGQRVARKARELAPRRTGNLRKSITATMIVDQGGTSVRSEIGPTRYYGRFVEHGTSKMAARPFLAPALDAVSKTVSERVLDAATKAMFGGG